MNRPSSLEVATNGNVVKLDIPFAKVEPCDELKSKLIGTRGGRQRGDPLDGRRRMTGDYESA